MDCRKSGRFSRCQSTGDFRGREKKELVGEIKNSGQEWQREGQPDPVQVYDFPSLALGKATPYGVYDLTHNEGWISVGIDHDTAAFAAESIGR